MSDNDTSAADRGSEFSAGLGAWKPIETAPATRTLLVWHRDYGAVTAHILAGDLWGVYTPGVPMLFQKHLTPAPTHWMHRPEAPNAELTGRPTKG